MPTMNALYNDGVAVLLGDILFVNVYKLCVPLGDITLVDEVSDTISTLVEGELLQQSNSFDLDVKEETYLEIIRRKTSALLALCCRASIRMCGHGEEVMKAGEDFANAFGRMFQIADDWADFYKANEKDNKDRGVDIANGFITLPWIYLKASVQGEEGEVLNKILASKEPAGYDNPEIRELCSKYDIKGKMMLRMKSLYDDANQALDTLDQSFDSSELRIFLKTLYKKITLENHG